jgi:hypothetical protein
LNACFPHDLQVICALTNLLAAVLINDSNSGGSREIGLEETPPESAISRLPHYK